VREEVKLSSILRLRTTEPRGLIPVVGQDGQLGNSGAVLMPAFANRYAVELTLVHRQATSEPFPPVPVAQRRDIRHVFQLVEMTADLCEADSLLFLFLPRPAPSAIAAPAPASSPILVPIRGPAELGAGGGPGVPARRRSLD